MANTIQCLAKENTENIQFNITGGLEPIPAVTEEEAGYTLDRLPVSWWA